MYTVYFEDREGNEGQFDHDGSWTELQEIIKGLRREGYSNIDAVGVDEE